MLFIKALPSLGKSYFYDNPGVGLKTATGRPIRIGDTDILLTEMFGTANSDVVDQLIKDESGKLQSRYRDALRDKDVWLTNFDHTTLIDGETVTLGMTPDDYITHIKKFAKRGGR